MKNIKTQPVTLSQCMIVKNEEKNIEKALSWGKDIVCEQIVVDTGSTDRTVEIAGNMGAKVYHFEWIKDFAAAKNFAIEKASGKWIAFLDADEYIAGNEVQNVLPLLETIHSDPALRRKYMAVNCLWIQLNDMGKPKEVLTQERIFRNHPLVRYVGKIHEHLSLEPKDVVHTKDFRIMHTGYTGESFLVTGKASRNIELLREALKEDPDDINMKGYLAVSLGSQIEIDKYNNREDSTYTIEPERIEEVERLYKEILDSGNKVIPLLRKSTYDYYLERYANTPETDPQIDEICQRAYREFPHEHRFMCYYAMMLNKKGDYANAIEVLKKCEKSLEEDVGNDAMLTTKVMGLLTAQMVLAAQGLGDIDTTIKYAEIMLLINKANMDVLRPFIAILTRQCPSPDEVYARLGHIYDLSSKRDLLLIARAAKDAGAIDLAKRIIEVVAYLGDV